MCIQGSPELDHLLKSIEMQMSLYPCSPSVYTDQACGLEGGRPHHQVHAQQTQEHERRASHLRVQRGPRGLEVCVGQVSLNQPLPPLRRPLHAMIKTPPCCSGSN